MENIINDIQKLKKERNAVILAHYYVDAELQKIADYVGDSYYLAKAAKSSDADTIVFCGVRFMGESAKILNPEKTVIMPDMGADCPMAHMVSREKIAELKSKYPDLAVVCYINSTAEIKALSDVCVTSSNAVKIVRALENKNIYFIPDKNLGSYIKEQVPEKNIILGEGFCPIHNAFDTAEIERLKREHPSAPVISHPECRGEVLAISDFKGSTSELIEYSRMSKEAEFIVCTERGVLYEMEKRSPEKKFYFADKGRICADMKLNTLEKLRDALQSGTNVIEVSEELRKKALVSLDRMMELGK